jgi:hypothetical protein
MKNLAFAALWLVGCASAPPPPTPTPEDLCRSRSAPESALSISPHAVEGYPLPAPEAPEAEVQAKLSVPDNRSAGFFLAGRHFPPVPGPVDEVLRPWLGRRIVVVGRPASPHPCDEPKPTFVESLFGIRHCHEASTAPTPPALDVLRETHLWTEPSLAVGRRLDGPLEVREVLLVRWSNPETLIQLCAGSLPEVIDLHTGEDLTRWLMLYQAPRWTYAPPAAEKP